jgi:hypothetical protein
MRCIIIAFREDARLLGQPIEFEIVDVYRPFSFSLPSPSFSEMLES